MERLIYQASGKVAKKNPCLDKIWRKGKGKGSKNFISSMGRVEPSGGGGDFKS